MQKLMFAVLASVALLMSTAAPSLAVVNCAIVKKDLDLGRKPDDIAERMGITVANVQECKNKGAGTTGDSAAPPKSDNTPKAATPPPAQPQTK